MDILRTQNQYKADTIKTRQRLDFHIQRRGKLSLVCVSKCVKIARRCKVSDWIFIAYHKVFIIVKNRSDRKVNT